MVPCVQQLLSGCPALAFHAAGSKSRLSQSHISNFLYAYIHTETNQKPPDLCSIMKIYLYISTQKPAGNEILLHSELKINLADRLMQCKHSCSMNVCVVIYSHNLLA